MIRLRISRAFRLPVFALVLVFALSILGPGFAMAKVERKNGHKGTDGDPIGGLGSPSAGGGGSFDNQTSSSTSTWVIDIPLIVIPNYIPATLYFGNKALHIFDSNFIIHAIRYERGDK